MVSRTPQAISKVNKSSAFYLDKNSLIDVKVDVQLFHFNSYKYEGKSFGEY